MAWQSQNGVPTRSLYIGAAGEHYIMSECFRHRMEAFKLPIDKGFDLIVTHAYHHLDPGTHDAPGAPEIPIYLQVKSLQAKPEAQKAGQRPEWRSFFRIKRVDLDLLLRTRNSALACVLFVEENSSIYIHGRTAFAWWHSSEQLRALASSGHFVDDVNPACVQLNVRFIERSEGARNENAYLKLMRADRRHGHAGDLANGENVPLAQFDFGSLARLGERPHLP